MTDYKQLCAELVDDLELCDWPYKLKETIRADIDRARAALAEPEPQRRCFYSPVQIAECGGPCEQGPEHCDCGELWVTEPGAPTDEELILTYAFAVAEAVNAMCKPLKPEDYKYAQLAGLRAVLARWGADQELEACCSWADATGWYGAGDMLRATRRSKPPSLKEQALALLDKNKTRFAVAEEDVIRLALESLPD